MSYQYMMVIFVPFLMKVFVFSFFYPIGFRIGCALVYTSFESNSELNSLSVLIMVSIKNAYGRKFTINTHPGLFYYHLKISPLRLFQRPLIIRLRHSFIHIQILYHNIICFKRLLMMCIGH